MYIVIYTTAKDKDEGKEIAQKLLGEKLVACVNILPAIESFYWWQDKIESSQEVLLVIKSKKGLFKKIVKTIQSVHSYDVPEIIALPIIDGSKNYLKWLSDSVKGKK